MAPSTRRGPPSTHCAVAYRSKVPVPFFLFERVRSLSRFLSHRGIRCMSMAITIPSPDSCPKFRATSICRRTDLAKPSISSFLSVLERTPLNHSSVGEVRWLVCAPITSSIRPRTAEATEPTEEPSVTAHSMPRLKSSRSYVAFALSDTLMHERMFSSAAIRDASSRILGLFIRSRPMMFGMMTCCKRCLYGRVSCIARDCVKNCSCRMDVDGR